MLYPGIMTVLTLNFIQKMKKETENTSFLRKEETTDFISVKKKK